MRPGLFGLAMLGWTVVPASAQLFEISAPTFCAFVSDDGTYTPIGPAVNGQISRASLTHEALYFLFTIIGGQTTLDQASHDNRLDAEVVILGGQSEPITGLGILQPKWLTNKNTWIAQFKQNGFFTYRTYMMTPRISEKTIQLQIRDKNNRIVKPVASSSVSYVATVNIVP
jgi:hypothetical protein